MTPIYNELAWELDLSAEGPPHFLFYYHARRLAEWPFNRT